MSTHTDPFAVGAIVRVLPQFCDSLAERATLYEVVTPHEGKGRVDISPLRWSGAIRPMQVTPLAMLEPLRVVITNDQGAEQSRCTLAEFARDNAPAWPKRLRAGMAKHLAERIASLGSDRIDCGAGGVFTLTPEKQADQPISAN